ncbi:NUDIX hydrolase [Streptomyces polyrhachis]|uniref:NUDIX hydrolase n=1 Tax=Streptomyces polyrhachis TaxID=1282885 RepID=A0ABW2GCL2_9ACTN
MRPQPETRPEVSHLHHLHHLLARIDPWDDLEREQIATAATWAASGAPLWRTAKPATPPIHLVSYFVALDAPRGRLLLTAHRASGLWLPPGGHVEPGETPWAAVRRECREELGIEAMPWPAGTDPLFLTITETRGPGRHTDVSLWHLIHASPEQITAYDEREFSAIRWPTPAEVLTEPTTHQDPHLHRFTRKLLAAQPTAPAATAAPCPGSASSGPGTPP